MECLGVWMEPLEVVVNPSALVIGCIISAAAVVAAVVATARRGSGMRRGLLSKPIYLFTLVIVALAFVLSMSQGIALMDAPLSLVTLLRCVLDSIHDAFQIVSLDGSPRITADGLLAAGWGTTVTWLYLTYQSALFVLTPATAYGSVAVMLLTLLSTPALRWLSRNRDTYVFSEVNDASITLAKSIVEHYAKPSEEKAAGDGAKGKAPALPLIVFAEMDHADETLADEARTLRFVCSDKSIEELAARCSTATRRCFLFSSSNEAQNLRASLRMADTLNLEAGDGPTPSVIVFSTSTVSDGFVDAAVEKTRGKGSPTVLFRRFDHVQNTINQVLMERPVFLNVSPDAADQATASSLLYSSDERRVLVVGAGTMGMAFLKGAIWSCQSNDIRTRIDVVDNSSDARGRLALEAPEVVKLLGPSSADDSSGQETYDVEFLACDVYSEEFGKYLGEHGDEVSYVFVSLGDDLESTRAARRVREMLERNRVRLGRGASSRPPIVVVVDDTLTAECVTGATSSKGQPYEITPVGTLETIFSFENVFQPDLDRMARNLNAAYWGIYDEQSAESARKTRIGADASYDSFEYNRISSRASAIFLKRHLFEFCRQLSRTEPEPDQKKMSLPTARDWARPLHDPALKAVRDAYAAYVHSGVSREPMQELEHRRWNAFMRTLGYECCDEKTLEHINEGAAKPLNCDHLARLHICLVPFDELDEVDEAYKRVTGEEKRYKLIDDNIINHLTDIVEDGL